VVSLFSLAVVGDDPMRWLPLLLLLMRESASG
jgi:hypothetical protein